MENQSVIDWETFQALRHINRAIELHSKKLGTEEELTVPQLLSLIALEKKGPLTVSETAREVQLSPSTMIGVLDRLQEKGWIHRERGRKDRRLVYVRPTKAGKELLETAPSPLPAPLLHALGQLAKKDRKTLARTLKRVTELMEGHNG